jgi:hypothetical protein
MVNITSDGLSLDTRIKASKDKFPRQYRQEGATVYGGMQVKFFCEAKRLYRKAPSVQDLFIEASKKRT